MAIKGYVKTLYIDGVFAACIESITTNIDQPTNEVRHKGIRNIKGVVTDQIDEQSGTFELTGVFTDDFSNIVGYVDWLQGKGTKAVEIHDGQNFGDRALFFDAYCESDNETDQGILKFNITLKSDGNIKQGVITPPSLFTFYSSKVGSVFINAAGDNNARGIYTDEQGNTITMPYDKSEADGDAILMRGENAPNGLPDFKTLTANNAILYGAYDFSGWTGLENAYLAGNNFDALTFVDGQFNTGSSVLDVTNSFVQGEKFTDFIIALDTAMTTPRTATLKVGTIDDPLLIDPSDQTGTYAAYQSLIAKGWNITVVSNRLFTATIGQQGSITPSAIFSGIGSVVYTKNGDVVSNMTNTDLSPNTFDVNNNDIVQCWFANNTNDLTGLDSVLFKNCNSFYINFDVISLNNDVVYRLDENTLLQSNIDLILNDIQSKTTTGLAELVLTECVDINALFSWEESSNIVSGNYQLFFDFIQTESGVNLNHHFSYTINSSATGFNSNNFTEVDWGDGVINNQLTHIYDSPGIYKVKILNGTTFNINQTYSTSVIGLNYIGRTVSNTTQAFLNCVNLVNIVNEDYNNITNSSSMFQNCNNLNVNIDFENFYNTTATTGMFRGCSLLPSFTNINSINPVNCNNMFFQCSSLNINGTLSINWSNTTTASNFFSACTSLGSNISLNMPNLQTAVSMFQNTNITGSLNLDNLTSLVSANNMFRNADTLSGTLDLSTVMLTITNYSGMFYNCSGLTGSVTEVWNNPPNTNLPNVIANSDCFFNCNFTNQNDIPIDWK